MPGLSLQTTVQVEEKLDPQLEQLLIQEMKVLQGLTEEAEEADAAVTAMKARIESIRAEVGAKRIELPDDYAITQVDGGNSSKLMKKAVYALGISKAQLDACYKRSPKKGHTRFWFPGDRAKEAANKAKYVPRDERDVEDRDDDAAE